MVYVWLFCVIHGCLEVSKYSARKPRRAPLFAAGDGVYAKGVSGDSVANGRGSGGALAFRDESFIFARLYR